MAYTLAGPAGNAASWAPPDPTKVSQVMANTANMAPNAANTWQSWGQNFAGNMGGTYDPSQVAPSAPYNPMNGAQPGVSLGQVASGITPTPGASGSGIDSIGNVAGGAQGAIGNVLASGGGYPAINPGESSMAYMQRIGMSPADAQAAYAMSQANPGMSFQQIMQQGGFGYGGSSGSGQTATPNTLGGGPAVNPMNPGAGATNIWATPGAGTNATPAGWNTTTGYGPGTGPGSSSTSFGVPPAIAQYLDPSMAFQQAQGLRALQSSAAAQGNLLSGNTLKDITNYSQGLASTGYNNAFNQAAQQQGFGAGLSQQDWLNNLMLAQTQAGQGQYGTTGTANTNNLLATLLSQNALAAGNAGAAGTIGGANAITGGLQQAIANMLAQNLYNRIPALNPTGP